MQTPTGILRETLLFRGDEILSVEQDSSPSTHAAATLKIRYLLSKRATRKLNGAKHLGPGIYACFFEGRLFYVGIFAGNGPIKKGNVIKERWKKHIGGMTLRGDKVTICKRDIKRISAERVENELAQIIDDTDLTLMSKDQGLQSTYCKYRFAAYNWAVFRHLNNDSLSKFQFSYVSFDESHVFGKSAKKHLKKQLSVVESKIVHKFKPPCNREAHNETGQAEYHIRHVVRTTRSLLSEHIAALYRLDADHWIP